MQTRFFDVFVTELLLAPKIIRMFLPQNMLSLADKDFAGSFSALLVGWLVVASARGLYLPRHLFTL